MRTEEVSRNGNFLTHNVVIDNRPKGIKTRVGDFFRDRDAAKQLLRLSRQVSDANGTLPNFMGKNSHQEPINPERPHDQKWTEAHVFKDMHLSWSPRLLRPLKLRIPIPLLKISDVRSTEVDNRVSNEKDESGRSIQTRYSTTERALGIVHIGRLVLGTTDRHTTRRVNGHSEQQDMSYNKEITAYDTNAAQMIRDFHYAIENDHDSLPNRAKRKKEEKRRERSDRWYYATHPDFSWLKRRKQRYND